ncbi:MAG: hypothetical protein ACTSQA_00950 [Candidatus Heimdallarchaeaceae archaeon]
MDIYQIIGQYSFAIGLVMVVLFLIWRFIISPRLEVEEEEDE